MAKIEIDRAPERRGHSYPGPFVTKVGAKHRRQLGEAAGLEQFGVNLSTLPSGAMTALRHWHESEDEFVWIVSGDAVLIDDDGEHPMGPGDCAGFPAGQPNGHHIVNRSDAPVVLLEIGSRAETECGHYPDDDLTYQRRDHGTRSFAHKDGSSYD